MSSTNFTPPSAARQKPFHLNVNTKAAASTNKAPSLSSASSCSSAGSSASPEQPSTPVALTSSVTLGAARAIPSFLQSSPPTFAVSPPSLVGLSDLPDAKHTISENGGPGFLSIDAQPPRNVVTTNAQLTGSPADDWLVVHASPTSFDGTFEGTGVATPRRVLFEKKEAGEKVLDWESGSKYSLETVEISASGQQVKELKLKSDSIPGPTEEDLEDDVEVVESPFLRPLGNFSLSPPNAPRQRPRRLGQGAWSNVFLGVMEPFPHAGLSSGPQAVAVKQPLNSFSKRTIEHEAIILSYIQRSNSRNKAKPNLVEFYGFDEGSQSILMKYIPGPRLDEFITEMASENERNRSNLTIRLPVVGTRQWIFVSEKLTQAFLYLKNIGVVHGDIKPHNIFLRECAPTKDDRSATWWGSIDDSEARTTLWEPVIGDFTSSFIVDADGRIADDEEPVSAVTKTYCAPELLQAFTSTPQSAEPRPIPTFASDLYSIAMTILQTAIGTSPYSEASNEFQKNNWIQQGDPVAFLSTETRFFKCKPGSIVDRSIKGCFGKTSNGRTTIDTLAERFSTMGAEWRAQMAQGNESWVWGQ